MRVILLFVLLLSATASIHAFFRVSLSKSLPNSSAVVGQSNHQPVRSSFQGPLQMAILPQIAFVGACVFGIVSYVYTHIDEIKMQQEATINRTMTEQKETIKSAQEAQRAAIEKAQSQQRENAIRIQKIADDAKRNAGGK